MRTVNRNVFNIPAARTFGMKSKTEPASAAPGRKLFAYGFIFVWTKDEK